MGLTPDQQRRCDEIVEQALTLDVSTRDAFVMEACGDDEELLREATAVLAIEPRMMGIFQVSPDSSMAPPQFGRYQTEARIGSGGMSMVYRAHDPVINRPVAVKVMARHVEASPDEYRRFLSELHLLGSLRHPNIVRVFDAGEHEGSPFIVMEYLEGETLADAIAHGHCKDFGLKLNIARQIASALQRVHAAAVCHRDVKPANVFLEPDGGVKLMDFGISARLDGPRLTETGALIGTLPYLAPEQIRGEKLGPSVDIYAFGVLLFELFTGTKPFSGTVAEILYNIVHEPFPIAALSGMHPELVNLVRRSTAKEPSARPRDMAQVLQCLNQLPAQSVAGERPRNWRGFAIGAAASVALVAAGGFWIAAGSRSRLKNSPAVPASAAPVRSSPLPQPALPEPEVKSPPKQERAAEVPAPKLVSVESPPPAPQKGESHTAQQGANRPPEIRELSSSAVHVPPAPQALPPEPIVPPGPKPQQPSAIASEPPDPVVARPSESKTADTLHTEEPKAALPAKPVEDGPAADVLSIRAVLKRLVNAYRTGNIREVQAVRTLSSSDLSTLSQSFAADEDYSLEPQFDPEVTADKAEVHCRQTRRVSSPRTALQKQSHKIVTDTVIVQLKRSSGAWKIDNIASMK